MSNPASKKRPPKFNFSNQSAIATGGNRGNLSADLQDAITNVTQKQTATNVPGSTSDSHNLDSSVRVSFDDHGDILISPNDLTVIRQLGRGQYGIVEEVQHKETSCCFAVKRVALRPGDDNERTRLLMDVDVLVKSTECKNIIKFFGALLWEGDLWILMELMDCSLYKFYRLAHKKADTPLTSVPDIKRQFKTTPPGPCPHISDTVALGNCDLCNPIPEKVLGRMAADIVNALNYLYSIKVIHRDIKPSNILINRVGIIKLCDFGISGYLVNSVARTYEAGCRPYMAPERIDPPRDRTGYDIKSDVWSFGITMLEVATGRYPYQNARDFFEQLKSICADEPPKLTRGRFTPTFEDFIGQCLRKDYNNRPKYGTIEMHPFISSNRNLDIRDFTEKVLSYEIKT